MGEIGSQFIIRPANRCFPCSSRWWTPKDSQVTLSYKWLNSMVNGAYNCGFVGLIKQPITGGHLFFFHWPICIFWINLPNPPGHEHGHRTTSRLGSHQNSMSKSHVCFCMCLCPGFFDILHISDTVIFIFRYRYLFVWFIYCFCMFLLFWKHLFIL